MKVVAVVQARQGSTRLPGKALLPLGRGPVVLRVVERAAAALTVHAVVVATTDQPRDDALVAALDARHVPSFRGSETDVLDRVLSAARVHGADVVVRLTGDCPLLDPAVVDRVVAAWHASRPDYASNVHPPTFPDGLDVEVVSRAALDVAAREARRPSDREHVTPYLWRQPERFRCVNVTHDPDLSALRWTLDTPQDYAFVQAVYAALHAEGKIFGMEAMLGLLRRRPELANLNRGLDRNEGYARSLRADAARDPRPPAGGPP